MYFIRHNKLKPPYNNYQNLNIEELEKLATLKVNPDIQEIDNIYHFDVEFINSLKEADIFTSESLRTQETATQILKKNNLPVSFHIDQRLNEIYFSPKALLRNEEISGNKVLLSKIRENIYPQMFESNSGVEDFFEVKERVLSIIKENKNGNSVFFTHGFLIRFILALEKGGPEIDKNTFLSLINQVQPVNFLEPVSIMQIY